MYSYEDRVRAVMLYIKYDKSAAADLGRLGLEALSPLLRRIIGRFDARTS